MEDHWGNAFSFLALGSYWLIWVCFFPFTLSLPLPRMHFRSSSKMEPRGETVTHAGDQVALGVAVFIALGPSLPSFQPRVSRPSSKWLIKEENRSIWSPARSLCLKHLGASRAWREPLPPRGKMNEARQHRLLLLCLVWQSLCAEATLEVQVSACCWNCLMLSMCSLLWVTIFGLLPLKTCHWEESDSCPACVGETFAN